MDIKKHLQDLVEDRKVWGITQQQIANEMGTTQSAISDLENFKHSPSIYTFEHYVNTVEKLIYEAELAKIINEEIG